MDATDLNSTNRLLRVIIALLLRGKNDETPNLEQQIELLDNLGLGPTEIAQTLGRTPTHVSKELAGIREKRKR